MPYDHFADLPADIRERAARVKLAVFDVDGVLTDGKLWYTADGHELKAFNAHDGLGFKRLLANGIEVAIITARISNIVTQRMAELGVAHVYQDQRDKLACLGHLLHALRLEHDQAAYTGDDLPDLAAMRRVGLSIAVANAHPWVRERAHWRTQLRGGDGAAREVCDLLLAAQGRAETELTTFGCFCRPP
ncbi:MAG: HAD hydrolase family protein [Rhodanobacter sp.]|jgi:3-deoxy-D-manno-octulosonate 8-phosphate phosphatase (KDO 8-P phosphatase)|nr:HAD hydrolase family protein [Rhodanobacter sp.]